MRFVGANGDKGDSKVGIQLNRIEETKKQGNLIRS